MPCSGIPMGGEVVKGGDVIGAWPIRGACDVIPVDVIGAPGVIIVASRAALLVVVLDVAAGAPAKSPNSFAVGL